MYESTHATGRGGGAVCVAKIVGAGEFGGDEIT